MANDKDILAMKDEDFIESTASGDSFLDPSGSEEPSTSDSIDEVETEPSTSPAADDSGEDSRPESSYDQSPDTHGDDDLEPHDSSVQDDNQDDIGDEEESIDQEDDATTSNGNDEDSEADDDDKKDGSLREEVFSPLTVKGRTVRIRSVEHLRSLAQQGANASETLRKIKPYRKIVKTLEKQNLLGSPEAEEKLNLLLDAFRGEPKAIANLVRTHDIDLADLVDDDSSDYVPKENIMTDSQVQLQEVIDEIKNSPHYSKLFAEIEGYDQSSKKRLHDNPDDLRALHSDLASGAYEQVVDEIDYLRSIGKISRNTSFIDSYIEAATSLSNAQMQEPTPPVKKKIVTRPAKTKKKSMQQTKGSSGGKPVTKKVSNPLGMSDEEFIKSSS